MSFLHNHYVHIAAGAAAGFALGAFFMHMKMKPADPAAVAT